MLDGWSKTFAMTGWRLGFGVWPRALVDHVKKLITVDHSCTSVATQMAGLAAITGPMDEIEAFRQELRAPPRHRGPGPQRYPGRQMPLAGRRLLCLPQYHGHRPRLARTRPRSAREGLCGAVLPGESFGANGKGYLRISYAASEADIREALAPARLPGMKKGHAGKRTRGARKERAGMAGKSGMQLRQTNSQLTPVCIGETACYL